MVASKKPRVVASIEARMNSSRFPGKMLSDLSGRPALIRLVDRLRRATTLDAIVVATTAEPADDPLARAVEAAGIACFRGSESDVLNRVVEAHRTMATEIVVEVTGDCPLTDPKVIDHGVNTFLAHDVDVVSNVAKPSFPIGIDVQVFGLPALAKVEATRTTLRFASMCRCSSTSIPSSIVSTILRPRRATMRRNCAWCSTILRINGSSAKYFGGWRRNTAMRSARRKSWIS